MHQKPNALVACALARPDPEADRGGGSGSGETTFSRCSSRLEPTQGEIRFGGHITGVSQAAFRLLHRRVQMVFQNPFRSLNPRMTVRDTLREPLMLSGIRHPRQQDDRIRELVRRSELEPDDLRGFPTSSAAASSSAWASPGPSPPRPT